MANEKENVNPTSQIEDLPEPQISEPQAGQTFAQAGGSSVTLESILSSPELEDYVDKVVKQKQDVRLGKYGTRLDTVEGAIKKYDALVDGGMSKSEALSKMQGDQELSDIKDQLAQVLSGKVSEASAGAGSLGWKERRASILSEAGIEGNDPRFVEFMKQKFSSYDDMNEQLYKQAEDWSFADETKPKPSAGTVAQVVPSVIPVDGEYDDFNDESLEARIGELARQPIKNKDEITKLAAELKARASKK